MWSLGVILYEMMTFSHPFIANSPKELAQRVCVGRYLIPRGYSADLLAVTRRLLQVNPSQRPIADELLKMQCIQSRMPLISQCVEPEGMEVQADLLSPIKLTTNLRNVHLPSAAYHKKVEIVKPLENRLHIKKGIPIRNDVTLISSPEMQLITDCDWWSPNKRGEEDPGQCPHTARRNPPAERESAEPKGPKGKQLAVIRIRRLQVR
jgi:NIMA (never in mitosis gene a)-related kinase